MNAHWVRFLPRVLRLQLEGRHGLQAIVANTGWLFFDKALRITLGIVVGAWLARYLGPSRYGELAYVLAFVAIFQAIGKLGLDSIVVRDIARDPASAGEILGTTLSLRLAAGLFLWCAAIIIIALLQPGDTTALILTVILASTIVFQSTDTVDLWFQSQLQSRRTVFAKSLAYLGGNGLKVVLILLHAPLVFFASAWLLETVIASFALYIAYTKFRAHGEWRWQMQRAKLLMHEAWPYLLSSLGIMIYMRIDQIMLREMIGEKEVGIFSAAIIPSEAWYFIATTLLISVAPSISRRKKESQVAYLDSLKVFFSMMWLVSIIIAIVVSIFSSTIISLLYGDAYQSSAHVLATHIFAIIPVFLGVASNLWLTNEKRGDLAIKQTLLGAAVNITLNLYLIPLHGSVGAAISTVVSQWVSSVLVNAIFAWPLFKIQILSLFSIHKSMYQYKG